MFQEKCFYEFIIHDNLLIFQAKTIQSVVKQASSSQQQTVTKSKQPQQDSNSGPLITASNVIKAFTSSSTITKTTMRASRVVTGHVPKTPQPSVDLETQKQIPSPKEPERKSSLVSGTSNANFR